MRICIPIEFHPHGGGYYFLECLKQYLDANGHQVHQELTQPCDLLFTNHWMVPRRDILRAFRANPDIRIVQRIDGAAQDYGRDPEADDRQRAVNNLADLTIFQSEYCRYSTRVKYPVITQDGPVVHNPVDTRLFSPKGSRRTFKVKDLLVSISWSPNPMKGAHSVYAVAAEHPELGFVLCGNFPDVPDLPNIHNLGVLNRDDLAEVLRSCDAMLTFSRNEACPNHVLEALSSGLPILYIDSGAMAEIVGDAGLPVTVETFSEQFHALWAKKDYYSKMARARAEDYFSRENIFPLYMKQFNLTLNRPPRTSALKRLMLAWTDAAFSFIANLVNVLKGKLS